MTGNTLMDKAEVVGGNAESPRLIRFSDLPADFYESYPDSCPEHPKRSAESSGSKLALAIAHNINLRRRE